MRPPSDEEKSSALVSKSAKDNKIKRASASEDQELKKRTARKLRKNIIPLTEESVRRLRDEDEEEENDGSVLVARVKETIDAPKIAGSMAVDEAPPRTEGISEKDSGKVPELLEIEDASQRSEQTVGISEGTDPEALRTEENSPSDSLGGAIREARALGNLEIDGAHEGEDPFHKLYTGIEDAAGQSDASGFSSSSGGIFQVTGRAEQSRREADFRGLSEERNALKLLSGQKKEEIEDLRAELAKARQDQTSLIEQVMTILKTHGLDSGKVANVLVSQQQQKIERIKQFHEEISTIRAESLGLKEGMDYLAAEKEIIRSQLSSAKSRLRGLKENSSAQAKKIGDLEAQLASELARAKTEAEKAKAEVEVIVAVYRDNAEAAQGQAKEATETTHIRAVVVHRESCSRSRTELRRYEAELQRVTEERNSLKLFLGQSGEEIKDLRAELSRAHQDQIDFFEQIIILLKAYGLDTGTMANLSVSQLQQKIEMIGKLREEVDMKEKGSVQARKIEELKDRLASVLAKAESNTKKAKADVDALVAIYRADAEAAQVSRAADRVPPWMIFSGSAWRFASMAICKLISIGAPIRAPTAFASGLSVLGVKLLFSS
uniref:Golgin subfamily A member 2-like n=1 Tax=Nicotiana tabacum TaxID=4097 RepID=A0A1S4A8A5_TOBAC|nr:PREDICTED: golgin subfamily A member 2-like [Nicotiana tabacum]